MGEQTYQGYRAPRQGQSPDLHLQGKAEATLPKQSPDCHLQNPKGPWGVLPRGQATTGVSIVMNSLYFRLQNPRALLSSPGIHPWGQVTCP